MIPRGIILDCACVLLGTNVGSAIKDHIPSRIKEPMNVIFGVTAMAIGMISLGRLHSLPAVILALVLGGLIGEVTRLEERIQGLFQRVLRKLHFSIPGDTEAYMRFYLLVTVTLCASGTNLFGAFQEGLSGDMTILLSKAVMDIFAAALFATTLGRAMNLIVLPQFVILSACFYAAPVPAAPHHPHHTGRLCSHRRPADLRSGAEHRPDQTHPGGQPSPRPGADLAGFLGVHPVAGMRKGPGPSPGTGTWLNPRGCWSAWPGWSGR